MATSPDGVLTATFDPVRNLVSLLVAGQAWPAPGVLRTNLAPDPRLTTAAWQQQGSTGTMSHETVSGPNGHGWFRYQIDTSPTASPMAVWTTGSGTDGIPVSEGQVITISSYWYQGQDTDGTQRYDVNFYDSSGADVGNAGTGDDINIPQAGAWFRASRTITIPAGVSFIRPQLIWSGTVYDAGDVLGVADLLVEVTDVVRAYFDGWYQGSSGLQYSFTGPVNASPSIEEWVYDVPDQVTITRSVDGASPIPVRGAEMSTAPGGTFVWSDNEAPMDASVAYTVEGYAGGELVGTSTVTVETTGAVWGVWVKVPGRPELTVRAPLVALDDETRETLGGSWQIPGGPRISQSGSGALAQSAGMGALTTALTLQAVDRTARAALDRAVRQAPGQVLLIQTGQPEELASGYYQAGQLVWSNPAQVLSDQYAKRYATLPLTEAVMPAGPASGWTGVTYTDVTNAFDTYQAIDDAGLSYMDVATGEGWS